MALDPLSVATDGYLSKYKWPLSIATRGYLSVYALVAIQLPGLGGAGGGGGLGYVTFQEKEAEYMKELRKQLIADDEDILLILQIFMMRWN